MSKQKFFQDRLLCFSNAYSDEDKPNKSIQLIKQHSFIYSMSILIPGVECIPKDLISVENIQYFTVSKLKLKTLVEGIFIEAFIKKGSLSMLSVNKRINADSTFCILPTGILIMNLSLDHYECLGLEGKKSKFFKENNKRVVEVDLKNLTLGVDSKRHQRLLACLSNFTDLFDVAFNWCPPDVSIDHRSLQAFLLAKGYVCKEMQAMRSECTHQAMQVPSINPEAPLSYPLHSFHEWLGMVICQCSYGEEGSYENHLQCPQPSTRYDKVAVVNLSGFFATFIIEQIVNNLRTYLQGAEAGSQVPWACISLHGFQDCPVSLSNREHQHRFNGDNSHSLLLHKHSCLSLFNLQVHALPM